jgi:general secretion pathway protein M
VNLPWLTPWVARWNALAARERRALSMLAAFLGVILFYFLVWNPVHGGLATARARASAVQAQLVQVREQAARVAALRNAPRAAPPSNPVASVEQAAERFSIRAQLKSVEAEGVRGVRLQFEGVSFSSLTACLLELQQRSGLRAESATLVRQSVPGTVNAQLVLRVLGS